MPPERINSGGGQRKESDWKCKMQNETMNKEDSGSKKRLNESQKVWDPYL